MENIDKKMPLSSGVALSCKFLNSLRDRYKNLMDVRQTENVSTPPKK